MSKQAAKFITRNAENLKGLQKFLLGLVPEVSYVDFFYTHPGLYVDESFQCFVLLAKAKQAEATETNHFDLPHYMTDTEVEWVLKKKFGPHIWAVAVLCVTLQKLIEEQRGGKSGKLLNNGFANIFCTSSYVVCVHWSVADREWHVSTWQNGGYHRCYTGCRAFSPAT